MGPGECGVACRTVLAAVSQHQHVPAAAALGGPSSAASWRAPGPRCAQVDPRAHRHPVTHPRCAAGAMLPAWASRTARERIRSRRMVGPLGPHNHRGNRARGRVVALARAERGGGAQPITLDAWMGVVVDAAPTVRVVPDAAAVPTAAAVGPPRCALRRRERAAHRGSGGSRHAAARPGGASHLLDRSRLRGGSGRGGGVRGAVRGGWRRRRRRRGRR